MTANELKCTFDKYTKLPLEFWESVFDLGEIITVDKEIPIKRTHQVENHLYYIIEGSGGILLWNRNNFVCTDMVLNNDFLCDFLSFITRKQTPYEVVAFEKSVMLRISFASLSGFLNQSEYGDKFWRFATQALYIDKHLQFIQSVVQTAENIYRLILEHQPEIVQRIPQKYIASYLGITPQSLSRIRRKIRY
jgi:CRP-like cAMP-binding protein